MNNLEGLKFGRLTVLRATNERCKRNIIWECLCECGKITKVIGNSLKRGNTKSCGCLSIEKATKHGLKYHSLYSVWCGIKRRCYYKNGKDYEYCGVRGITVCEEWLNNPEIFIKWALSNGWQKGLTIDRTDNDGNYEPSNCRFVTNNENQRNKRLGKTGIRYVSKQGNSYQVSKRANGKSKYFGCFKTLEEAKIAAKKIEKI